MQMMEIFKIRIKQLNANAQNGAMDAVTLFREVQMSRAAQEYYTTGLIERDRAEKAKAADLHARGDAPLPIYQSGEAAMIEKYNLTGGMAIGMENLAIALADDIKRGLVRPNGSVDFATPAWTLSNVLRTGMRPTYPRGRAAYTLMSELAADWRAHNR